MKKIYGLLTVMIVLVLGASTRSYAVSFSNHSEYDSCGTGVSFYYSYTGGSGGLTEVTFFGDGTSSAGTAGSNNGYNWHNYGMPGIYTVKHVLYVIGAPADSVIFTDTVMCKSAYITAYLDVNSNCTWNTSEPFLRTPINVEIDSAGVKIDTISLIGGAYRPLTAGKTYSMRILNLPSGLSVSCPSGGIRTATVAPSGSTIFDFGLQCGSSASFDVTENVSVRSGRHAEVVDVMVSNNYCTPQTVTLTANLSPKYATYVGAYPAPATVTGNVLTWTLPNVSAFNNYHISIHYEVVSTWLTPGDTIHTSFYVTPTTGDINIANNSVVRVDTVKSSFDPNAKTVFPAGEIAAGASLEYSIEFENDGNAAAQNIHILDTLSANLDINSMKVVSSSAPITNTSVIQVPGYNVLRFDLPGINLPDSSHHGQCTGMVIFSIKARAGLASGVGINNRAGIYFDDNPVVMTGYAQNKISATGVGVNVISAEVVSAYPNPVHDILNIMADGKYGSAQIINTMGQVLIERNISGKATLDLGALANGIYYLILRGEQGMKAQKIEKK